MIEISERYTVEIIIGGTTYAESLMLLAGEPAKATRKVLEMAQEIATYAVKKSHIKTKEDIDLYRECTKEVVELCKTPISKKISSHADLDENSESFEKDVIIQSHSKQNIVATVRITKTLNHSTAFHHQAVGGGFHKTDYLSETPKKTNKPSLISRIGKWFRS